ncbi:Homeobox domain [Geosmithia morbida]|uniref:Homeobox domain n=1 Tax=Geosmithia morbida TaxID=1094350 RepID=A0A9P5D6R4_9HYPO|nr:Homeobox domain [Geosmithia morbida]KAF4123784.1 Homeobox domain [Geosmithia morbida]
MADDMDEFVNWDHTGLASATDTVPDYDIALPSETALAQDGMELWTSYDVDPRLVGMMMPPPSPTTNSVNISSNMNDDNNNNNNIIPMDFSLENIDLTFENIDEDEFSYGALQHFATENPDTVAPQPTTSLFPSLDSWTFSQGAGDATTGGFPAMPSQEDPAIVSGGVVPPSNPGSDRPSLFLDMASSGTPVAASATAAAASAAAAAALTGDGFPGRQDRPPPKIGARFSRESVRILKDWLSTHNRHPYPSDEEKEVLQRKTGLNKTQITNWLANARRRGKVQPPRTTSPHPANWSVRGPVEIPQRRATPSLESMNPLQRWQHSPPENEPASVTAIARAVTTASSSAVSSSGMESNFAPDDGSGRSLCNQSSASSLGTSRSSNGSSAYSYSSLNSWGSFGSATFNSRSRRRRRRKPAGGLPQGGGSSSGGRGRGGGGDGAATTPAAKTFQCTFCTETFRTKHDWQRHEKSLHLSLERWVCAPWGSRAAHPETGQPSCVFCGAADPDEDHIEGHNHSTCQERSPGERTFYRKDHLNQHLKLVHNVKFMDWSMRTWKMATPEIRARCGFCGIQTDSWAMRVDHLADHFKTGSSMADWKGDWGFDPPVLGMIENSIPPYLIHHERASPLPYVANGPSPETPRNAYELIKLEMAYFDANKRESTGRPPTDREMMMEGCRVIFASETLSFQGIATQASWLRDVIMKSDGLQNKARFGPLRSAAENRLASLKINGKDNLFEQCPMEFQLQDFVRAKRLLGLTPMDDELQDEACRIVGRVEDVSANPSDTVANWLLRLITESTSWLAPFRRRAQLPRTEDLEDAIIRSTDPTKIDSTVHNYSRLESELAAFLRSQRAEGAEPSDDDLQRQARIIIYEFDDGWNQTAADNISWLEAFKARHAQPPTGADTDTDTDAAPLQSRGQGLTPATAAVDSTEPGPSGHAPCSFMPDTLLCEEYSGWNLSGHIGGSQ